MPLEVQSPENGELPILGVLVATPKPSPVTIANPTDGNPIPVLGVAVIAHLSSGSIVVGLPE